MLDRLSAAIRAYLTTLDQDAQSAADHRRLDGILTFTMNLELAGDVVEQALIPHAAKRQKRGLAFAQETEGELARTLDRLAANLRAAAALFMTDDPRAAETSTIHLDLLRDMKLINGHIVAAAAYPALERAGRLLPSQIANDVVAD